MQKTTTAEETLLAKKAFELFALEHGHKILAYHADNVVFAANAWREACKESMQGLTFAGVNAHHQNGIAERRIKELTELSQTHNCPMPTTGGGTP